MFFVLRRLHSTLFRFVQFRVHSLHVYIHRGVFVTQSHLLLSGIIIAWHLHVQELSILLLLLAVSRVALADIILHSWFSSHCEDMCYDVIASQNGSLAN
jgi:hypothetical protein